MSYPAVAAGLEILPLIWFSSYLFMFQTERWYYLCRTSLVYLSYYFNLAFSSLSAKRPVMISSFSRSCLAVLPFIIAKDQFILLLRDIQLFLLFYSCYRHTMIYFFNLIISKAQLFFYYFFDSISLKSTEHLFFSYWNYLFKRLYFVDSYLFFYY